MTVVSLKVWGPFLLAGTLAATCPPLTAAADGEIEVHSWRLEAAPQPEDNRSTPARVELGKALFFDPRLSGNGALSCASCHNPSLGWSDALPTAVGMNGKVLGRATPTILNTAYNTQFMWDGRKKSLEDQALGPMLAADEMNADMKAVLERLRSNQGYREMFQRAYPGEPIDEQRVAKAIAAFERTIVATDSPFDRWVAGDDNAMTPSQLRGYKVFVDPAKGNCAVCHAPPNFTDNGFHNIGLAPREGTEPDLGRYNIKKVAVNKGAFKTPTLRDIERTAPYFRDGSATTLRDVVDHYVRGGKDHSNLSSSMRALDLSEQEKEDLVAFMRSLTSPARTFALPTLPQ